MSQVKDSDDEPLAHSLDSDKPETGSIGGGGGGEDEEEEPVDEPEDPMEEDAVNPAAVFCIRLNQPSSNANAPFWIPIHIVIPERPTECAVFNVNAGTNAQEVRAMVLDKQAGLLNPSALVPEPWQASGETLSGIDPEATAVEPALVPHIQNMPRPRGADAAGLLLLELELRPPAKERGRRNMYGEPWSGPDDMGPQDDTTKLCNSSDPPDSGSLESCDVYYDADGLLPRKRGMSERDAAFGLNTSVGPGQCFKRQRHRRSGSW